MKETQNQFVRTEFETGDTFFDHVGDKLLINDIDVQDGEIQYTLYWVGQDREDTTYTEEEVKEALLKIPDDKF